MRIPIHMCHTDHYIYISFRFIFNDTHPAYTLIYLSMYLLYLCIYEICCFIECYCIICILLYNLHSRSPLLMFQLFPPYMLLALFSYCIIAPQHFAPIIHDYLSPLPHYPLCSGSIFISLLLHSLFSNSSFRHYILHRYTSADPVTIRPPL